jgi:hypothetical protein
MNRKLETENARLGYTASYLYASTYSPLAGERLKLHV